MLRQTGLGHLKQRQQLALTDRLGSGLADRVNDPQPRRIRQRLHDHCQVDGLPRLEIRDDCGDATTADLTLARVNHRGERAHAQDSTQPDSYVPTILLSLRERPAQSRGPNENSAGILGSTMTAKEKLRERIETFTEEEAAETL